jgi:hypothetical protein
MGAASGPNQLCKCMVVELAACHRLVTGRSIGRDDAMVDATDVTVHASIGVWPAGSTQQLTCWLCTFCRACCSCLGSLTATLRMLNNLDCCWSLYKQPTTPSSVQLWTEHSLMASVTTSYVCASWIARKASRSKTYTQSLFGRDAGLEQAQLSCQTVGNQALLVDISGHLQRYICQSDFT